jgi:hypothetical protein
LQDIYSKIRVRVKANGKLSSRFRIFRSNPQGRPASTIAWNVLFHHVIEDLCASGLIYRICTSRFTIYVFADDTLIVSNHPSNLYSIIELTRRLVTRVEMRANVSKSAIMIMGPDRHILKERLVFRWGDSIIPIVSEYKYLGIWVSDSYGSSLGCWTFHLQKLLTKANVAFHRCSEFLTNMRLPIDWRLTNFAGMVAPMYSYGACIWFPTAAMLRNIVSSYARKLRYTVGNCGTVNTALLCTVCGIPDAKYWLESTRVTFKYRTLRKDVPGVHRHLAPLLHDDTNGWTRWSAAEQHGTRMGIQGDTIATPNEIKVSMAHWRREHFASTRSDKLDPLVLERFVLHPRHFLVLDQFNIPIPSWRKPQYRKWLTNSDFALLVSCLGGGSNLLNTSCICFGCGEAKRSWAHIRICRDLPDSAKPDLIRLSESKQCCLAEIRKLRNLCDIFTPVYNLNLSGHLISRLVNDAPHGYYVTRGFDDRRYRVFDLATRAITIELLDEPYAKGKIYIFAE